MAIQVTCSKCLTRFNVSDKFAGKKGPCPKCKETIQIPDKSEEIVIHAPKDDSPKDSTGKSVLKPITRKEASFTKLGVGAAVGAIVLAVVAAVVVRSMETVPTIIPVFCAILLGPPLAWAGYGFARDQELEPYDGQELWIRIGISTLIFAGLWLLYATIPPYVMDYGSVAEMPIAAVAVAFVVMATIGSIAASLTYDFEGIGGIIHYGLYMVTTFLLALLAGIPMFSVS